MHKFEEKVLNTIKKYKLLTNNQKVIVGVSGGADSMALLSSLVSLGYNCIAVHINHSLRGEEADNDQKYVEKFCLDNNIQIFSKKSDVMKISKDEKISLETAGRNVRYAYFNEIAKMHNIDKIAVAHNKSDSVETTIFNMIRGASISGLKGISVKNGNIIRPIIEISREEIVEYLQFKNIDFRVDKTNLCDDYTRNKIRNKIIPLMKEINESVIDTIYSNSKIIEEENEFINECVSKYIKTYVKYENESVLLDTKDFKDIHSIIKARLILHCIRNSVKKHIEISKKHIDLIMELSSGKKFVLENNGLTITNNYGILCFKVALERKCDFCHLIYAQNCILNNNFDDFYEIKLVSYNEIKDFNEASYICIDNINKPIYIRNRKNGDKIEILNVGTKKIKDIFIDKKIQKDLRDKIPVIATDDEVLCVYNINVCKKCMVNKNSNKILMIKTKD